MTDRPGVVFLDRDGVINENLDGYVRAWESFRFLPGALDAIARLTSQGWRVVVITNQSGIGRGLLPVETLTDIHRQMCRVVEDHGGRIDNVRFCPHTPDDACACRKPSAGMLRDAAAEFAIDLRQSYVVGDHLTDAQAALAAGCRPILVMTGRGRHSREELTATGCADVPIVADLSAAVTVIEAANGRIDDAGQVASIRAR